MRTSPSPTRRREFQAERSPSRCPSTSSFRSASPIAKLQSPSSFSKAKCLNCYNHQLAESQTRKRQQPTQPCGVLIESPEEVRINARRAIETRQYMTRLKQQI